jgi:drug/metabolite transporter (DMT)-like permease
MHEKKIISAPTCLILLVILIIFSSPVLAQEVADNTPLAWVSVLPALLAILLVLRIFGQVPQARPA